MELIEQRDQLGLLTCQKDNMLKRAGLIALDSERLIVRAMRAGAVIEKIVCSPEFFEKHGNLFASISKEKVSLAPYSLLREMTGFRIHGGVMALAIRPIDAPIKPEKPRIAVLNGCNNAENIGAIVRNCLAFGFNTLIVDEYSCSPWLRRALRVAMGSTFKIDIIHSDNIINDLSFLRANGHEIFAAEYAAHSLTVDQLSRTKNNLTLVLGHESEGISPEVSKLCDASVHIDMNPGIDSLNVAVASGILMHQMR